MAETSEGWDGTVNEATIARILAAAAGPRIDHGFTLSVVDGQRRVILSPGQSHHGFIRYVNDAPTVIDLPVPATGTGRWYLIAQRRDWAANTVTTVVLPADTTSATIAAPVPTDYPADFEEVPGIVADFPMYWVWCRSTDTQVRIRRAVSKDRAFGESPAAEWATKTSPESFLSPYKNNWNLGYDSGGSINSTSYTDGILIGEDGIYEAVAKQRSNGSQSIGASYIGLAINGDRAILADRAGGAWFHDHAGFQYDSSESRYLGPLMRGEKVTAGPPVASQSTGFFYGSTFYGGIWLRRLS